MYRIIVGIILCMLPQHKTYAQLGIVEDILKRVIMAIDLRIQRAQTAAIEAQDVQQQVENTMQKNRLEEIRDWVQRQKDLYEGYYRELWQVKNSLIYFSKVKDMIARQANILKFCRRSAAQLRKDPHFSAQEIDRMLEVINAILEESATDIKVLQTIIGDFLTEMDDADRLKHISEIGERIDKNSDRLGRFYQECIILSLQRTKSNLGLDALKKLYAIP